MEIKEARMGNLDSAYKYGNQVPTLELVVDKWPRGDEFTYVMKDTDNGTAVFGETPDGAVSFFAHVRGLETGYGGRVFEVDIQGERYRFKGPWSSRSGAMNARGFTPSIECTVIEEGSTLKLAAHLTVEKALAIHYDFTGIGGLLQQWDLIGPNETEHGDITYYWWPKDNSGIETKEWWRR